jgi:hypothetical protein
MTGPAIKSWRVRPVPGGWGPLTFKVAGHAHTLMGSNPSTLAKQLEALLRNNGEFVSVEEVWARLNAIWCERDPSRCIAAPAEPADHRLTHPGEYGPALWATLSVFGMRHSFDRDRWLAAVRQVTAMLDPAESPDTGCSECYEKWRDYVSGNPPEALSSPSEVARWVYDIHDAVNVKLGKWRPRFAEAARLWAWDVEI